MKIALMIEGQEGVTWEQWVALAQTAEHAGFEALFRSDHYVGLMGDEGRGSLDAWATISALAAVTERIRLGTLVSPATFRHPSVLYKGVVTADHVSGGRIELGMGAGWNEREHEAYGFDFPDTGARYRLLEEQVEIVRRLLTEEIVDHRGESYRLDGVRPLPPPVQSPLPLIIGGSAGPRSLRLAARFADEYNTLGAERAALARRRAEWDRAWEAAGRDRTGRFSVMTGALIAHGDSELRASARRVMDVSGADGDPRAWLEERRDRWVIGTPAEAVERLGELADLGVDRVMLQHLDHADLEAVELIGEQVIPQVSGGNRETARPE